MPSASIWMSIGGRVPSQLREELKGVAKRLESANAA